MSVCLTGLQSADWKSMWDTWIFFFFLLYWVSIAAHRLSLVVEREGYSFVAVHGLLTALSSLVAEHGLQAHGLQQLQHRGSVVVALRPQSLQASVAVVRRLGSCHPAPLLEEWLLHLFICLSQKPGRHSPSFPCPHSHRHQGLSILPLMYLMNPLPSLHPNRHLPSPSHHHLKEEVESKAFPCPLCLYSLPSNSSSTLQPE